jgi:hypothetical protein
MEQFVFKLVIWIKSCVFNLYFNLFPAVWWRRVNITYKIFYEKAKSNVQNSLSSTCMSSLCEYCLEKVLLTCWSVVILEKLGRGYYKNPKIFSALTRVYAVNSLFVESKRTYRLWWKKHENVSALIGSITITKYAGVLLMHRLRAYWRLTVYTPRDSKVTGRHVSHLWVTIL